jgi:hypothetical protein
MAKRVPLDEKPFNPIESALVERVASRLPMASPGTAPAVEKPPIRSRLSREKRFLLSWEEELDLQRLLDQLTKSLQTPVKLSNAIRSCLILLRYAQDPIAKVAARKSIMGRPPNNDQAAIAVFEQHLAEIFQLGFQLQEK